MNIKNYEDYLDVIEKGLKPVPGNLGGLGGITDDGD